jgi:hypothetical protein
MKPKTQPIITALKKLGNAIPVVDNIITSRSIQVPDFIAAKRPIGIPKKRAMHMEVNANNPVFGNDFANI